MSRISESDYITIGSTGACERSALCLASIMEDHCGIQHRTGPKPDQYTNDSLPAKNPNLPPLHIVGSREDEDRYQHAIKLGELLTNSRGMLDAKQTAAVDAELRSQCFRGEPPSNTVSRLEALQKEFNKQFEKTPYRMQLGRGPGEHIQVRLGLQGSAFETFHEFTYHPLPAVMK